MKKILIGSVVVIGVVTVAGAVAVQSLLDGETIAKELRKEAKSRLNRELTFAGPVNIKLFPKIAVQLPATSLSYANSDKPQVTLDSASVGVMVLPLLKGEVKLDTIKIDGLKGKINVERLKSALDRKQATIAVDGASKSVDEKRGGISFIKDFSVHGIDVFNSALTLYGLPDKKVYTLNNINLSTGAITLKGETGIRFSSEFSEKMGNLNGDVGVDTQFVYDLATLQFGLEKFAAHLTVNQKGVTTQLQLTTPKVVYAQGDLLVDEMNLGLASSNDMKIDASMSLSSTNKMGVWSLGNLSGRLKTGLNGNPIEVPFDGRASIQMKTETVATSVNGLWQAAPFSIQLQSVGFAKPGVTGRVKVDRLVLDDWFKASSQSSVTKDGLFIGTAWANPSTDLMVLSKVDANVDVNVENLRYRGLDATPMTGTVLLRNGKLTLSNWKIGLCEGVINGSLSLNTMAQWNINAQTKNVNAQCVVKGLGATPWLDGVAVAKMNVSGVGLESVAIKKTATGTLTAEIHEAQLKGLSLEKIANAVREKALDGLVLSKEDVTALNALSLKASVGEGSLNISQLTGKSKVAEVSGQVKVGLVDEQLSGKVMAKFGTSIGGRRVVVPIDLGGTITDPSYQLDVADLVKAQIKEELQNPELLIKGLSKLLKR